MAKSKQAPQSPPFPFPRFLSFLTPMNVLILFVVTGLVIFGYSTSFGFILDDEDQIILNGLIHSLSNALTLFTGSSMNSGGAVTQAGIYYKPFMQLCYMISWAIFGNYAPPLHVFQLVIHICNSYLLFLFLQTFLKKNEESTFPFFGALLFLVHPVNVEAVVYIADLQDTLFTFFGLCSLLFFSNAKALTPKNVALLTFGLLLAMFSKESGVFYVIILLFYAFIFHLRKSLLAVVSVFLTMSIYLYMRLEVAHLSHVTFNNTEMLRADLATRLMTSPLVLCHYFMIFFFPKDVQLTQDWAIRSMTLREFWLPLLAIVAILTLVLSICYRWRNKTFIFFVLWSGLGLGAHAQIVPIDGTVSDRWFYFPIIGFIGAFGILGKEQLFKKNPNLVRYWVPAMAVLLLGLSVRSFARTLDWENGIVLYSVELTKDPTSFYINNNMGVEFFRRGKFAESIPYFEKSTQKFPGWTINWNNLGAAYAQLGRMDLAEPFFKKSVENGRYYLAYENYARSLLATRKYQELRRFLETEALPIFPHNQNLQATYKDLLNRL